MIDHKAEIEKQDREMRKNIDLDLSMIYRKIGIDRPENHNNILSFCFEDVKECADRENWHSGDVAIAFRRFLDLACLPYAVKKLKNNLTATIGKSKTEEKDHKYLLKENGIANNIKVDEIGLVILELPPSQYELLHETDFESDIPTSMEQFRSNSGHEPISFDIKANGEISYWISSNSGETEIKGSPFVWSGMEFKEISNLFVMGLFKVEKNTKLSNDEIIPLLLESSDLKNYLQGNEEITKENLQDVVNRTQYEKLHIESVDYNYTLTFS